MLQTKKENFPVIFLDIDGVLQPCSHRDRFNHLEDAENIIAELDARPTRYPDFSYRYYSNNAHFEGDKNGIYDILAVYFDWIEPAVTNLKHIIEETNAKIVVSTTWREFGLENRLLPLMQIQNLDQYVIGSTFFVDGRVFYNSTHPDHADAVNRYDIFGNVINEVSKYLETKWNLRRYAVPRRAVEIFEYLDRHQEITSYVVLDDIDMTKAMPDNAVCTDCWLTAEDANKAIKILQSKSKPFSFRDCLDSEMLTKVRKMQETVRTAECCLDENLRLSECVVK